MLLLSLYTFILIFFIECCKAEFGRVHGCNVFKASCETPNPTPFLPDTGDEIKLPTGSPTRSGRTSSPTPMTPTSLDEPESQPPTALLRKYRADQLNFFFESTNVTGTFDLNEWDLQVDNNSNDQDPDAALDTSSGQQSNDVADELLESLASNPYVSKCKCVNCAEDTVCGGLWKGYQHAEDEDTLSNDLHIHIVVSHCKSSLNWLQNYTGGFVVSSIHIITKCGHHVEGAPDSAIILKLPNVGRCDHTYAWFISHQLPTLVPEYNEDSIVVFLKDDISDTNNHQSGEWSEFRNLINLASNKQGFACGINSMNVKFSQSRFSLSAMHETKTLAEFAMDSYQRNTKGYSVDSTEFKSQFDTLGSWWSYLTVEPPSELTPVCYGGVFSAKVSNIRRHEQNFWNSLTSNLSRGNNIQEGHYLERTWALLMNDVSFLPAYQVDALFEHADGVYTNMNSMHGALMQLPKLFLHVGAKATSSTEVISASLIEHISHLKSDGYQIAVHGKHDPVKYDFPNIDRLASCMWSDQIKQSFPDYMLDATICPNDLLSKFSSYMEKAVQNHQDMVVLNPWLSRRDTANSLALFLDPVWEVHPIIYYRRYFQWITTVFEEWRSEILEHASRRNHFPFSSFRYIDFIREYCKRLFYGKDVNEDGYPIRSFRGTSQSKTFINDTAIVNNFDQTSNIRVEDLTDLTDYTYFVAQEYSSTRFRRHVTIVNYHETNSMEVNFNCRVLHDAHNACRASAEKMLQSNNERGKSKNTEFPQTNHGIPIDSMQIAEDLVVAAVKARRLQGDSKLSGDDIQYKLRFWAQHLHDNVKNITKDLPLECLFKFETTRLLEVSLAYEKSLLPAFYDSPNGAADLVREFKRWRFCSVDTDQVLNDAQWDFLFDFISNEHPVENQFVEMI